MLKDQTTRKSLPFLVSFHPGCPLQLNSSPVLAETNPTMVNNRWLTPHTGPNVPGEAIQYRMRTLRKEGAILGISGNNSSPVNSPQRTTTFTGKRGSNGHKRKAPANEDAE